MKEIIFADYERCQEAASKMNPDYIKIVNNEKRGASYYKWEFALDSVYLSYNHGHGNRSGRFAVYFLIKGGARKMGKGNNPLYYNEEIEVNKNS